MFPLRMFTKMGKSEMEDRADLVLKRVNLDDAHHKMPSEASGGMQKRVAIGKSHCKIILNIYFVTNQILG